VGFFVTEPAPEGETFTVRVYSFLKLAVTVLLLVMVIVIVLLEPLAPPLQLVKV
jgi:hypothetical protein